MTRVVTVLWDVGLVTSWSKQIWITLRVKSDQYLSNCFSVEVLHVRQMR